jgi:hypothetical protein
MRRYQTNLMDVLTFHVSARDGVLDEMSTY